MLDLPRLRRIELSARPFWQVAIAHCALWPNYTFAPGVRIDLEGLEKLPSEPVVFAMNHTDRYNYWPFQYVLYRRTGRFTATWVKGKYYEHPLVGAFMEATNNIPVASRGYLITRDFIASQGRHPKDDEYEALRAWVDGEARGQSSSAPALTSLSPLLSTERDMLGRPFVPARQSYAHALNALFDAMMGEVVRLNEQARSLGLDVLIFPQGTRSVRLSKGHIGVAQIAARLGAAIVPVGCSGSDGVYPGGSPWGRRGHIRYRIGEPLSAKEIRGMGVPTQFVPFSLEAERDHRAAFQRVVDVVMDRINGLVDPEYRFDETKESQGVRGSARFV